MVFLLVSYTFINMQCERLVSEGFLDRLAKGVGDEWES